MQKSVPARASTTAGRFSISSRKYSDRLQEAGCHGYAPLVDHAAGVSFQTTAPDSIVMVEQWESVAHLEAHLQTPHMKARSEAVKGDVLETSIRILQAGV